MSDALPAPAYVVTQDDRTMGTLVHLLQLVTSWMGPLVIFFLKRDSPFVKFHALQALILQVCLAAFWIAGVVVFMVTMAATVALSGGTAQNLPSPVVFVVFPLFWIVGMSTWLVILVVAIIYAIKAGRGEWAAYPGIGGLARHLLKM